MWISFSEDGREKSLGDGFALAGFDPRFDGILDAFCPVFDCFMVPHKPVKSCRKTGINPR
jgi:hypothetical protein